MDESSFILALDQGTTSSRAILFNLNGKRLGIAQQKFKQYYPNDGWVEHDPLEIWDTQLEVIRQVITKTRISPEQIKAIGITNQRETTVVWNKSTGQPICNAIVWQDRRTSGYCEELSIKGYHKIIRDKTGLLLDPYFSATKLKYILDHVEGARAQAKKNELAFGTIDTWLIWNLTKGSQHLTDVTNASRTMLYNINNLEWDDDLLNLFEIPKSLLPNVEACDSDFGAIDKSFIGQEIPITGVAGDQHAALFGQQCITPGAVKNTYGTGCFLMMNTGLQPIRSENNLISTVAWQVGGEVNYAMEGSVFITGAIIQWLKDGLEIISEPKESELLANSVKDSGGVTFVPALAGLGAPHWDPYARGAIFGLNRATTKAHIVRAALESIALQVNDVVKAMEQDLKQPIKELKVDGGGITNEFLMQLQADLLEIVVIKPVEVETTALGIAFIAGLGASLYNSIEELKLLLKLDKYYCPNQNDTLFTLKQNWNLAINRSKNWIN